MAVDYTGIAPGDIAARARAVREDIREQQVKLPKRGGGGKALPYAEQPDSYRAVVTREQHHQAYRTETDG
ncbi:hypothetical protein ACL02T_32220 [Pseudonocardia sp. RS010]|uniref:hypothetical protein n=1 Tax=Pseudonocardia sp. RS010 TaxID=3385979 RepID=UPI0039A2DE7F